MIESSFAKQYGIRLSVEDISYSEYRRLFNGLMHDTPLGQYISIRSETDSKIIKNFSASEKEIYNEWRKIRTKEKLDNMSDDEKKRQVLSFQKAMKQAFFKGGK